MNFHEEKPIWSKLLEYEDYFRGREKRKRVKMRGNFSIGKIQIFARSKIIPMP